MCFYRAWHGIQLSSAIHIFVSLQNETVILCLGKRNSELALEQMLHPPFIKRKRFFSESTFNTVIHVIKALGLAFTLCEISILGT